MVDTGFGKGKTVGTETETPKKRYRKWNRLEPSQQLFTYLQQLFASGYSGRRVAHFLGCQRKYLERFCDQYGIRRPKKKPKTQTAENDE